MSAEPGATGGASSEMAGSMTTISTLELDLAIGQLGRGGMVTDLVAPSLAAPAPREALRAAMERRLGRPLQPATLVVTPGHGRVWAMFDPPAPHWEAEVVAVREAIRRAGPPASWPRIEA